MKKLSEKEAALGEAYYNYSAVMELREKVSDAYLRAAGQYVEEAVREKHRELKRGGDTRSMQEWLDDRDGRDFVSQLQTRGGAAGEKLAYAFLLDRNRVFREANRILKMRRIKAQIPF